MFTNILWRILNILFPKRNTIPSLNDTCRILTEKISEARTSQYNTLYRYTDSFIKSGILEIKKGGTTTRANSLSVSVQDYLVQLAHEQHRAHFAPYNILVYVPSSAHVLGLKDFDHMERVICSDKSAHKTLSNFFTIFLHGIEIRQKQVHVSQHHLSRKERFLSSVHKFKLSDELIRYIEENSKHAKVPPLFLHQVTIQNFPPNFSLNLPQKLCPNIHIYCIDDITTTGATFESITQLFAGLPVEVTCVAIAS